MSDTNKHNVTDELLSRRTIILSGSINTKQTTKVISQLIYLESLDPNADITLHISSPGGYVYETLGITDIMDRIKPDIRTIAVGYAMSGGAVILAHGAKGKRLALAHAHIMIHEPASSERYQKVTDQELNVEQGTKLRKLLAKQLAKDTGQTYSRVLSYYKRDRYMTAQEAKDFGIIDEVC